MLGFLDCVKMKLFKTIKKLQRISAHLNSFTGKDGVIGLCTGLCGLVVVVAVLAGSISSE